jgi:L-threonylcarbamoyladenylate synthase
VETRHLRVDPVRPDPAAVEAAGAALREGRLVVFPTETVYGIAARADDPLAVEALRKWKGREEGGKPLTLHLPSVEAVAARFPRLPAAAERLLRRRLPGPLTLVLPEPGGGTTGIRVPDDPVARAVLAAARCPVVASSVNRAGAPPATGGADAAVEAAGAASLVLDAGPSRLGRASTVVAFPGDGIAILRAGAIPARDVLEDAARILLFVCTGNLCRSPLAAALAADRLALRLGVPAADLPARGFACLSAGTAAVAGAPATPETVEAARVRGLDLGAHRSRPVTPGLLDRADRILVMERAHRGSLVEWAPDAAERIALLDPRGRDVPDPYGRGAEAYAAAAAMMERALEERLAGEA